jgi:ADP-glucose pyrophosphorylase
MQDVLAIPLAGAPASVSRRETLNTAKPAVPFAGASRIVDFILSNGINSGVRPMLVFDAAYSQYCHLPVAITYPHRHALVTACARMQSPRLLVRTIQAL